MKCGNCEHISIINMPEDGFIKGIGKAECVKYNALIVFSSIDRLNNNVCVKEKAFMEKAKSQMEQTMPDGIKGLFNKEQWK